MKVLQLCEEAQDPESFVSRDGETTQSYPGEISTAHNLQCHSHMYKGHMRLSMKARLKFVFEKMLLISYTFCKRPSPILISDKSTESKLTLKVLVKLISQKTHDYV